MTPTKKTKLKPKKKNPQDLTLRNLRAMKKEIAKLREEVEELRTIIQRFRFESGLV